MVIDQRSDYLSAVRSGASLMTVPVHFTAALPGWVIDWIAAESDDIDSVRQENERLRSENLILQSRLQRFNAVETENDRLRQLLSAARMAVDDVLLAELINVSLDPFTQEILVNRGTADGVYEGQPVLDPKGVMGQVTRVGLFRSAVSLITDPSQGIPVQIIRNGLRTLVQGAGASDLLHVPFLDRTADVREGDLLVTSGMGGRFPPGYPVARVVDVSIDINAPFLGVKAVPVAELSQGRQVLLVWPGAERQAPPMDSMKLLDTPSARPEDNG